MTGDRKKTSRALAGAGGGWRESRRLRSGGYQAPVNGLRLRIPGTDAAPGGGTGGTNPVFAGK